MTGIVYDPTCSVCHRRMGEMSGEEFEALVMAEGLEARCFDCVPHKRSYVPGLLGFGLIGDVLFLGGQEFWANRNVNGELRWRSQSHAHVGTRARSCLSSSTYLNTVLKSGSQETVFFSGTEAVCKCCGGTKLEKMAHGLFCRKCDVITPFDEIILPTWIVRDAMGEAIADNLASECPDCNTLRLFNRGRYCDYHHAMLVEQHEDGSLGYGNAK